MKRYRLLFIFLILMLMAGCWDRREMNAIGIVMGTAIDKDFKTGKYICTVQLILPANLGKGGSGGKKAYMDISGEGHTIFEAEREVAKKFDRLLFYTQNKIILINENVAREGLSGVLDFFIRDYETRSSVMVAITKNTEARKVLDYATETQPVPAISLHALSRQKLRNSGLVSSSILDFEQELYSEGINPILGVIEPAKHPSVSNADKKYSFEGKMVFSGTAVFINDRLIGFLDSKETEGLNFITGNIKSTAIDIPGIENKNEPIATEVLNSNSTIIPSMKGNEISFLVKIEDTANVAEIYNSTDVTKLDIIDQLEKEHALAIEKEVRKTIEKVQNEYKSDILGFGEAFSKKYPDEWENIKDQWETIFPDTNYDVVVKCRILRTGLINKKGKMTY